MVFPKVEGHYTGTGDLFAALMLANSVQFPGEPHRAVERVLGSLQAVIARTRRAATAKGPIVGAARGNPALMRRCELRLVQSRRDIEEPVTEPFTATLTPAAQ